LLQARDEVKEAITDFLKTNYGKNPLVSLQSAFHLQHMTGVLDRLFTYANSEQLNEQQLKIPRGRRKEDETISLNEMYDRFSMQVDKAIEQLP
jgi:hypothetical protein